MTRPRWQPAIAGLATQRSLTPNQLKVRTLSVTSNRHTLEMSSESSTEVLPEVPKIFCQVLFKHAKAILDDQTVPDIKKQLLAELGHLGIQAATYVDLNSTHAEKSPQWHKAAFEKNTSLEIQRYWAQNASNVTGEDVCLDRWLISNGLFLDKRRLMSSYWNGYAIYRITPEAPTASDISSGKSPKQSSSDSSPSSSSSGPPPTNENAISLVGEGCMALLNSWAQDAALAGQAPDNVDVVWIPLQEGISSQQDSDIFDMETFKLNSAFTSLPVAKRIIIQHLLKTIHTPAFKVGPLNLQIQHQSSFLHRHQYTHICLGGLAQLRVYLAKIAIEDPEVNWEGVPSTCLKVLLDALLGDFVNVAIMTKINVPKSNDQHSVNEKDWAIHLGGRFWIFSQESQVTRLRKRPFEWAASTYTILIRSTHKLVASLASNGFLRYLEGSTVWEADENPGSRATTPDGMPTHRTGAEYPAFALGETEILFEIEINSTPRQPFEDVDNAEDNPFESILPPSSSGVLRRALIEGNPSDHGSIYSDLSDSSSESSEHYSEHTQTASSFLDTVATSESQFFSSETDPLELTSDDGSDSWVEVRIGNPDSSPPVRMTQNYDGVEGYPDESASTSQGLSSTTDSGDLEDGNDTVCADALDASHPVVRPPPATDHPTGKSSSNLATNNPRGSVAPAQAPTVPKAPTPPPIRALHGPRFRDENPTTQYTDVGVSNVRDELPAEPSTPSLFTPSGSSVGACTPDLAVLNRTAQGNSHDKPTNSSYSKGVGLGLSFPTNEDSVTGAVEKDV